MSKRKSEPVYPTFFVPKSVYDEVFDDIQKRIMSKKYNQSTYLKSRCHQLDHKYFHPSVPALSISNILEAARQAFDDRNFRILYEIIYRGMDIRNIGLAKQLFEYLCAAIPIDPKITNKEEMLVDAVKGFHILENDEEAKKMIENAHKLIKANSINDDDSSSDSDKDDVIKIEISSSDEDSKSDLIYVPSEEE